MAVKHPWMLVSVRGECSKAEVALLQDLCDLCYCPHPGLGPEGVVQAQLAAFK